MKILKVGSTRCSCSFLAICFCFLFAAVFVAATTVAPPQFDELVNESDYIVRGTVKSVKSDWRERQGNRYIYTLVEVEVLEVISGKPPQPLVLEMLGGQVGGDEMVVQGMPRFIVGQEDILFVRGNGRQFYPLTAAMHGFYPVVREKNGLAHITRSNRVPLHDTAEVVLPMTDGESAEVRQQVRTSATALSPDDFTRQIRAAIKPGYRKSAHAK